MLRCASYNQYGLAHKKMLIDSVLENEKGNSMTLTKRCITPGTIKELIIIYGGPAIFLSKNETVSSPLKHCDEADQLLRNNVSYKIEEACIEKSVNLAKQLLPIKIWEGTFSPCNQELISTTSCKLKVNLGQNYTLNFAKEADEILVISAKSISWFLSSQLRKETINPHCTRSFQFYKYLSESFPTSLSMVLGMYNNIKEVLLRLRSKGVDSKRSRNNYIYFILISCILLQIISL